MQVSNKGLIQGLLLVMSICFLILGIQYYFIVNTWKNYCRPEGIRNKEEELRKLYVITPTYRRLQQIAELTRLAQTLMHVPDLVWLVIEDRASRTKSVREILQRSRIKFIHLNAPMPKKFDTKNYKTKPRGVSCRRKGLQWIRKNVKSGVVYFADDDNTYDIRLFEEMRDTKKLSMWPVGLLSSGFSSPIMRGGKLIGFHDNWKNRKYPVDMAEFAFSVEFLLERPEANMPYMAGFEEDGFLRSLNPFNMSEIVCKASKCTEILVWHTQTVNPPKLTPVPIKYNDTNLVQLYSAMV